MFIDLMWYVIILVILWIRTRFWNRQPMRHIYEFPKYGILSPPIFNKYCDVIKVRQSTPDEVIPYIQRQSNGHESPSHLMGYLNTAYISMYETKGCMTSRKVNFFYESRKTAYYHDFIYGDTDSIKRTLFQTHEYNRSIKTKCKISFFSSDFKIPFLIPVTHYSISWVKTATFSNHKKKIIKVTEDMLYILYEVFKTPLLCQVTPEIDQIAFMMKSKILSIYYYYTTELSAIFFFKNSLELEENESIVDWVGTILLKNDPIEEAISTLLYSFRKIYPIVRIHNVSHTPLYNGYKSTKKVYYIYNYGIKRISPKDCLFV